MDLADDKSTIGESAPCLITLKFIIEASPRIEVPNGQILKDQYNDLPECRYQHDITLANTIIHLLEKAMIADPVIFKKFNNSLPKHTWANTTLIFEKN